MNWKTGLLAAAAVLGSADRRPSPQTSSSTAIFAAGATGFSSEYTFSTNSEPGFYDVGTNPHADNGFWSYTGGTPAGAPSENMLIVNGGSKGTTHLARNRPECHAGRQLHLLGLHPEPIHNIPRDAEL